MHNSRLTLLLLSLIIGIAACRKDEPGPDPLRDQFEFVVVTPDSVSWEAEVLRMDGSVIQTMSAEGQKNFYTERTADRKAILRLRLIDSTTATSIRTGYRDLINIFDGSSNVVTLNPDLQVPYDLPNDTIDFANL